MSLATNPGFVPLETAVEKGANFVAFIQASDLAAFTTAGAAGTLNLFSILGNAQGAELVHSDLITPFQNTADAANNTTQIEVGDAGNAARLLGETELNANGTYVNLAFGTGTKYAPTANTVVTATLGAPAAGKKLSDLNVGKVALYFRIFDARVTQGTN